MESADSYWTGSAKPKVVIVFFSDFACPYCQQTFGKLREASIRHADAVKLIYRDFPMHEESLTLAMSARCAGEQGLFWPMHDKLFQNPGLSTAEEMGALATQIGADTARFRQCLDSRKHYDRIKQDADDGTRYGVEGTPTIFINGHKLTGAISQEILEKAINELNR
jgi:protein-disulfide isomerase